MRLFIAEKPSLGRAIAAYLPGRAVSQGAAGKPASHIVCGDDIVTWCFGHLYEPLEPDAYGPEFKRWDYSTLPIVPVEWRLEAKSDAKTQIAVIKGLLKEATEVVNAGDPDREGQLLVDELLEELKNRKPVKRLWLSSLDETNVKKALASMKPNSEYQNLMLSARSRQRADWLVGMNLTRAWTLAGRRGGYDGVLSIGRVQTPTAALVVNRCMEIENFKPKDFFGVTALINAAGGSFNARWKPADAVQVDEAGRVLDRTVADAVAARVTGKTGIVTSYEAVEKKQNAPLPYALSTLQLAASKRFGFGAQETLDTAQALYEAKLISYPRTDCTFLPDAQLGDAPRILAALPVEYAALVAQANPSLKSAAWNDAKVTAHHAMIPTGQTASLSGRQAQLYDMIVKAYLAQFFPPYVFRQTTITLDVDGEKFAASGKTPVSQGWKVIFGATDEALDEPEGKDAEDKQTLPAVMKGEDVVCAKATVEAKKTTPPAYWTEGTLIEAMSKVHLYVTDPEIKKRLKENSGIGTEATRANILETLKKRGLIAASGKKLMDTEASRKLILALPENLKSPGLTALFEQLLEGILEGRVAPEAFLAKQLEFVTKFVEHAKTADVKIAASGTGMAKKGTTATAPAARSAGSPAGSASGTHTCPQCKEGQLRQITGAKGKFWGCSRYREGCKATFDDVRGKPQLAPKKRA